MPLRYKLGKLRSNAESGIFSIRDATSSCLVIDREKNTRLPDNLNDLHDWPSWSTLGKLLHPDDPLREVTDELIECIQIFKTRLTWNDEYEVLRSEFETLFGELQDCYSLAIRSHITPLHKTKALQWFCRAIRRELSDAREKQDQCKPKRSGRELDGLEHVLGCYREIQDHIRAITLNIGATANIWDSFHHPSTAYYNPTHELEDGRGPCFRGTRVDVINQIISWTNNPRSSLVYWINGMAGTGKTTIAYSLCKELDADHRLAASFFCSRRRRECQDVTLIIPSIAYQLAEFSRPFHLVLSLVFEQDPRAHSPLPGEQFNSLILQPLLTVGHMLPKNIVVVIDALDQCDGDELVREIVNALLSGSSDLPIKFIVSTRPDPRIREPMEKQKNRETSRAMLHNLDKQVIGPDIGRYLRGSLESIQPTEAEMAALVEQAGNLFAYAATIVRYIESDRILTSPRRRLTNILEPSLANALQDNYSRDIDAMYTSILREALDDPNLDEIDRDDMRQVLYLVVCAHEPLKVDSISSLLNMESVDRVRAALRPLWSVLYISEGGDLVRSLHPSFPAYILDISRSKRYCCDPKAYSRTLAQHCFRIFRDVQPQFNICGLSSSYIPDSQVDGLEDRVKRTISNDLFYAAQNWAMHLNYANRTPGLLRELEEFLSERLLLWMEVMNLKNCAHMMPGIIRLIKDWDNSHGHCSTDLRALIHDAWLFATAFAHGAVSDSTPHIYTSMLPFWPQSRPISRCYAKRAREVIWISGTAMDQRRYSMLATWHFQSATHSPVYSADGSQIAVGVGNEVLLLNALTGRLEVAPFKGHSDVVLCVRFSPDGHRIVSSSLDKTIRVWNTQSGDIVVGPIKGHHGAINSVAFSPDGTHIVSGSQDDTIYIWDSGQGTCLRGPLTGYHGPITEVKYSSDGGWIVTCGWSGVIVWSARDGKVLKTLVPSESNNLLRSMDISSDGGRIVAGSIDNSVHIWDKGLSQWSHTVLRPPSDKSTPTIYSHSISVAFSSDSSYLLSSLSDGSICLWDTRTGKLALDPLDGHTGSITSFVFSPDNTYFLSSSNDKTLRVWHTQVIPSEPYPLRGHSGSVTSVDFSPNGTRIVSGSADQTVCVWSTEVVRMEAGPFKKNYGDRVPVAYSPGGTSILCNSRGGLVLLDALTGGIDAGPFQPGLSIQSAAFSPEGTRIILGSTKKAVRIIDADVGEALIDIHTSTADRSDWLTSVVPSPDGNYIAVGSVHSSLSIYDAWSGKLLYGPFKGHNNESRSISFSPDSTSIACGSFSTGYLRDIKSGEIILGPLKGHTDWVHSVQYSPDGTQIVSGARDNTICIWNAQTGELVLGPAKWHSAPVRSVKFSPDGKFVVSGSDDRAIRLTDVSEEFEFECGPMMPTGTDLELNADGWVTDGEGRWLVWVPPELRTSVMWPRTKLLISKKGWLRLHFADSRIGESWTEGFGSKLFAHY